MKTAKPLHNPTQANKKKKMKDYFIPPRISQWLAILYSNLISYLMLYLNMNKD